MDDASDEGEEFGDPGDKDDKGRSWGAPPVDEEGADDAMEVEKAEGQQGQGSGGQDTLGGDPLSALTDLPEDDPTPVPRKTRSHTRQDVGEQGDVAMQGAKPAGKRKRINKGGK